MRRRLKKKLRLRRRVLIRNKMELEKLTFNDGLNWSPCGNPDTVMNPNHLNGNEYIARSGRITTNRIIDAHGCVVGYGFL